MHRDHKLWDQPHTFNPFRFYDTNKKRHPFSFAPFLGGKRICIGKTFAEIVARMTTIAFLNTDFDFEFIDKAKYDYKVPYNLGSVEIPKSICKVVPRKHNPTELPPRK